MSHEQYTSIYSQILATYNKEKSVASSLICDLSHEPQPAKAFVQPEFYEYVRAESKLTLFEVFPVRASERPFADLHVESLVLELREKDVKDLHAPQLSAFLRLFQEQPLRKVRLNFALNQALGDLGVQEIVSRLGRFSALEKLAINLD